MGAGLPQLKAQKFLNSNGRRSARDLEDSSTTEGVMYVGKGIQITK
jgi:hypothetical protein